MSVIGTWGDIAFSVSRGQVKTFNALKWDTSIKYATHDRHLKTALLEYTGRDADSISFSMLFCIMVGVHPSNESRNVDRAAKHGRVARLIVGGKSYGKMVCTKVSKDLERFDHRGRVISAKVSVSLKEYAGR